jgi:hypothetical protein
LCTQGGGARTGGKRKFNSIKIHDVAGRKSPGGKIKAGSLLNPNEIKASIAERERERERSSVCLELFCVRRSAPRTKSGFIMRTRCHQGEFEPLFGPFSRLNNSAAQKSHSMHFGKQNDVDEFLACKSQGEKTWRRQDAMGVFRAKNALGKNPRGKDGQSCD